MHVPGRKSGETGAVTVRRMFAQDVSSVLNILQESPEASNWSGESLLKSAAEGMAWVADWDGRVAGFLVGRIALDEFEVLNLAVGLDFRRRGVATSLVSGVLENVKSTGARKTYLEVRASNLGAIALYRQLRFEDCGRRLNYYHDPQEDAVLLVLHQNESIS